MASGQNNPSSKEKNQWYIFKRYLFWNYRKFFVFGRWVKLRFSDSGRLLIVLAGITGALGADTTSSVTYQAFALLLVLLLSAYFISLFTRRSFSLNRHTPQVASVGEECHYHVDVTMKTKRPIDGVYILELGPDPRPTFREFVHMREPEEESRNWVDRAYSYYRWKWIIEQNKMLESNFSQRFSIFGDRTNRLTIRLTPQKRGLMKLTEMVLGIPDPLGLTYSMSRVRMPGSVLVLPERVTMNNYEFPGASSPESGVTARGSHGGSEEEFLHLRDYRPGDPIKQIHWGSSAKAQKLIVKEHQSIARSRCGIILDVFCPVAMAFEFEKLVSIAASVASRTEGKPVDLDFLFIGADAHRFSTGPAGGNLDQLMEILATVQYSADENWSSLVRVVEENSEALQGAVVITMNWNEERKSMCRYLTVNGVPNQAMVLNCDPESQHLADSEFSETIIMTPDNYKERLQSL